MCADSAHYFACGVGKCPNAAVQLQGRKASYSHLLVCVLPERAWCCRETVDGPKQPRDVHWSNAHGSRDLVHNSDPDLVLLFMPVGLDERALRVRALHLELVQRRALKNHIPSDLRQRRRCRLQLWPVGVRILLDKIRVFVADQHHPGLRLVLATSRQNRRFPFWGRNRVLHCLPGQDPPHVDASLLHPFGLLDLCFVMQRSQSLTFKNFVYLAGHGLLE